MRWAGDRLDVRRRCAVLRKLQSELRPRRTPEEKELRNYE